jgi:hypothetical protein
MWMKYVGIDSACHQYLMTFTYTGTQTRIITNLFKNTNIHIAYILYKRNSSESKETLLWFVTLIPFYFTNTITQLLTNTITLLTHQPSSLRLYSETALCKQHYSLLEVEVTLRMTVNQYVLLSSTLVGLVTRYYFLSECCCLKFASCIYEAPPLTRGQVCNLWCNHSMVRVAQNPKSYFTVSSETPLTSRARFPYLYPSGIGLPSYNPWHWVPFTSHLTTRRATVEVF